MFSRFKKRASAVADGEQTMFSPVDDVTGNGVTLSASGAASRATGGNAEAQKQRERVDPHLVFATFAMLGAILVYYGERIAADVTVKTALLVLFLISVIYTAFEFRARQRETLHDNQDAAGRKAGCDESEDVQAATVTPAGGRNNIVNLTLTDSLTGLGNRQRFAEKFQSLRQDHAGQQAFAAGLVNLDGMKPINDLYGTAGGDEVLRQCAMRFRTTLDGEGFVYRHEGDQFGFLLPDASDEQSALEVARMLQDILKAPFDVNGAPVRLSGSFGFALFPDHGGDLAAIINRIETALYHSKHKGRGRVTVYSEDLEKSVREAAIMEQALRRAISDEQITPHFQPIISLEDGSLLGFESLARWIDADLGFVSPGQFIPLAEERGLIAPLTEVLLSQSANVAADWPDDLFLSFNLSSAQLVDPQTAGNILAIIGKAKLPPHRLEIEVTETAIMSDPETAAEIIRELHEAGVRISMDDFGTGQSSLGRLRELKLDKVKIDRAFIMAIGDDKPAEHIVKAILEMCAGLELTVVAEGIEEIYQAESLKRFGCHAGQGYLFGKPQDAVRTMSYIRDFRRMAKSDREAKIA